MANKTLSERMTEMADELNAREELMLAIRRDEAELRWQAQVLWAIVYDGLPKDDSYYRVVAKRLGAEAAQRARERDAAGVCVSPHQVKPQSSPDDPPMGDTIGGEPVDGPSGADWQAVAEVVSWTNSSYGRNYKVRWLHDVPEGATLYVKRNAALNSSPEGMGDKGGLE